MSTYDNRLFKDTFQLYSRATLLSWRFPGVLSVSTGERTGGHRTLRFVGLTHSLSDQVSVIFCYTFIAVRRNFKLRMQSFVPFMVTGYRLLP